MKLIHPVGLVLLSCFFLLCAVVPVRADLRREAEALVNWKASLASADESLGSWSLANSTNLCRWSGIICDSAGHIAKLNLWNASLNGTLDQLDFSAFPHLKELSFGHNGLHGTIPAGIGNLTSLVVLQITDSPYLRGAIPRSIGQLKHLALLNLAFLGLDGTLPEEVGNLTSLEELSLNSVTLTGSIPLTIGMLVKLGFLNLSGNNLTGSIPLEIGNMTKLLHMDFSWNYLEGKLPTTISHLTELQLLVLSGNQLGGHIFAELGNSTLLDTINVAKNNFSGLFPSSVCAGRALRTVSARYNGFTGIHQQTFQNCTTLQDVDFTANNIVAELRDCFGEHPELEIMAFRQNQLYGSLLTDQGEVFLCNHTYLSLLDLSNNDLNGGLHECIGDLPRLMLMDLSRNSFSGVVPFSCHDNLYYLHLANNHFRGTFPLGLKKCKSLITLDLGGNHFSVTIPSWVSMSLPTLKFLLLSSNIFDGIIPHQIFHFRQLQLLDLSKNRLTGPIADNFTNFTGMIQQQETIHFRFGEFDREEIEIVWKNAGRVYNLWKGSMVGMDLSDNYLSQEIPKGLIALLQLRYLNLSGNHLLGSIPKDIGNLVLLESLDLSHNQLSGGIPPSFAALKSISVLNLSYNGLSGRIPTSSQLQTLVDPSIYSHNSGLCGSPLEDCVDSSTSTQNDASQAEDREALWVYCFVAAGFILGFWLYWGMFMFSGTWRCSFHHYVDNMQGKVTKKMHSCKSCVRGRGPYDRTRKCIMWC
ncbi:LRR receptor-like serine/threonine-protein kinase FLS2 [Lolium rigidum]|uniref:LRR receptor-like serine/threonine-protein kinase FLS2 n=1 Tax=Lolium rigidum TaxID=89674 RepID=UPI001F5E1D94|nr:LRR receptor-like serine/threonine-protein kinase FLS2 [Lolium rigidum]